MLCADGSYDRHGPARGVGGVQPPAQPGFHDGEPRLFLREIKKGHGGKRFKERQFPGAERSHFQEAAQEIFFRDLPAIQFYPLAGAGDMGAGVEARPVAAGRKRRGGHAGRAGLPGGAGEMQHHAQLFFRGSEP